MSKTFEIDLDKLSRRDLIILFDMIREYVEEHELPEDVESYSYDVSYDINVTIYNLNEYTKESDYE